MLRVPSLEAFKVQLVGDLNNPSQEKTILLHAGPWKAPSNPKHSMILCVEKSSFEVYLFPKYFNQVKSVPTGTTPLGVAVFEYPPGFCYLLPKENRGLLLKCSCTL